MQLEATSVQTPTAVQTAAAGRLTVDNLDCYYGDKHAVRSVSMDFKPGHITALIGPSGCGKSTVLRALNRLHETILGARATGTVSLDGEDIYSQQADPVLVRRKIGMVFQQPTPFRTRSIFENVAIGLRLGGITNGRELADRVEHALRQAALWDEVKDKLNASGLALSGGQQQRMCIARTIAVEPQVVLMDEPTSALDPVATLKIEELMTTLKQNYTIVVVTHNMQQAARVSDRTGVFLVDRDPGKKPIGFLVEYGPTDQIFTNPQDERTEEYITGRIG